MSRLPPRPGLAFRDDGTPVATAHDDVYFSAHDGLEETRAVFLRGCGLPQAWAGRNRFCIAELGFGTGLNFLALWDVWLKTRPHAGARLDFVSFEGFPLDREQAARALSRWPELAPLTEKLLARWPARLRGIQRVHWLEDGVSLTLHQGKVEEELPRAVFLADAWFLDGFSPAKNGDMWSAEVLRAVAERTRPGGRAATFTVAGAVRRGLEAVGFSVAKPPGFGRKRERLEAVLTTAAPRKPDIFGLRSPDSTPKRIAIIGAGIAGATLAWTAKSAGLEPVIFDAADGPASGASGNPLALVHPRLDAADTASARIHLQAGFAAEALYRQFPGGALPVAVVQRPKDDREASRQAKLLADPPLEGLHAEGDGICLPMGFVLRPRRLVSKLLEGIETRFGAAPDIDGILVGGEAFDAVVFAHAMAATDLGMPLTPKRGQVESVALDGEARALTRSNYLISDGEMAVFGATFLSGDTDEVSPLERKENLEKLADIAPEIARRALSCELVSRSGVRATSQDRLPLVGPQPDLALCPPVLAPLSKGVSPDRDLPLVEGHYVLTGLGSRGFTLAPLMAELVVSLMLGRPLPVSRTEAEALSPARFLVRDMKRGRA